MGPAGLRAVEIAARVRSGEAAAAGVVRAHLEAMEAGAALNAFTLVDAGAALQRAGAIDAAVARGGDPGPLAGVPVALKDMIDHAGRPTTCGSGFYRQVPARSATVVERIEAAGGIVIGRAGLHEFAFGFDSENPWFGPVHNPWDPGISPGGSSGGSAAAVAAGMAPLAVGTDTGGSVRVPAALCGLVGLKVTHGRVPLSGVFPLAPSLDTVGPLAGTVADAALLYRVMAGDDPADPWSRPRPVEVPEGPARLAGLRVGVPAEWLDTALDDETRAGFEGALERLAAAGAVVERVPAPLLPPTAMIAASMAPEVTGVHRRWFPGHPERYGEGVRQRMAQLFEAGPGDLPGVLEWRAALRAAFERLLAAHHVLATPAVAARRKPIGVDEMATEAGPVGSRTALSWFTAPVNHAGLPAIALPLDAPGEPPPSLQLIGPAWGESRLLAVGLALEEAGIVVHRRPPSA